MASESSSQSLPKTLTHPSNVHFECEDGNIAFNNSVALLESNVALLESKYPGYKDMLQFLTHCCISKALVIQPSTVYNKYLRDFWYSTEVDYVSLPDHEMVKDAIATLGLSDEKEPEMSSEDLAHSSPLRVRFFSPTWKGLKIDIAGILYDDLISKLIVGGKKGREKNICYTRYLSLVMEHLLGEAYVNKDLFATKSYQIAGATFKHSSEVPLTSYMRQVAKLDEEPLITPSEEVNIEAFVAMSLSGTSEHLVSKPKARIDKKRRTKKISSLSEPNISKVVNQTPVSQSSGSQHAEEIEVTADATQSLDTSKSAEEHENSLRPLIPKR
ncbi:hypothetical protein Tco_1257007 [Tanacetum coccineum]